MTNTYLNGVIDEMTETLDDFPSGVPDLLRKQIKDWRYFLKLHRERLAVARRKKRQKRRKQPTSYEARNMPRGSKHHHAKLTEDDVRMIKKLLREGERGGAIAELFKVTGGTISQIRLGRAWKHVK